MATQVGTSQANAGILASVFTLMSLPFSMTIPSLYHQPYTERNRRIMLITTALAGFTGIAMLLLKTNNFLLVDPEYLDRMKRAHET